MSLQPDNLSKANCSVLRRWIGATVLLALMQPGISFALTSAEADLESCLGSGSESESFDNLALSLAGDTTLATADVLKAYSPITDKVGSWFVPKALGVRLSASVPATTSTLADYGNAQILLRDGGLVTGYLSLSASPAWFVEKCEDKATALTSQDKKVAQRSKKFSRRFQPDRIYLHAHPVPPFLRAYMTHGIGMKAIRLGLEDDDESGEDASSVAAAGVFYFGLGIDGPVVDLTDQDRADHSVSGAIDLQIYGAVTRVNGRTLSELYQSPIDDDWVYNAGIRMSLLVTDRVALKIDFTAPLGGAKEYMDEVTTFSISYNPS